MWLVNVVADICSMVGLVISVYVLYGVTRLRAAKRAERDLMHSLLWVDEIDYQLERLSALFVSEYPPLSSEAMSLSELRGKITGSMKALVEMNGELKTTYPVLLSGYYTSDFIKNIVGKAKREVVIVAHHNRRLAEYGVMETIAARVNAGCKVKIFTLSPSTDASVLELSRQKLPSRPPDLAVFRRQLRDSADAICATLANRIIEEHKEGFEYWQYDILPRIHMVRVDKEFYVGFTNIQPDKVKMLHNQKRINPCLVVPANSPLGSFFAAQEKYLLQHSRECFQGRVVPAKSILVAGTTD